MTPLRIALGCIVVAGLAAAAWFLLWPREAPPPPPGPASSAAPAAPAATGPQYQLAPASEPEAALPPLKQSDPALLEALTGAFGPVDKLFRVDDIVRNVVATIDNLPREEYSSRLNPARPIPGAFATVGRDEELAIAPSNAARYAPWVAFAESLEPATLVALYVRFYPLFQQAYVELGYPQGYFNDRLVEVIDHLLAAPELPEGAKLVVPRVLYEYAEPDLETLSSGHKAMMRTGNANAARLKARLRQIRAEIVARTRRP